MGTILVVEDNEGFAELITYLLSDLGCSTFHASDAEEGWRLFGECMPDAVVTDNVLTPWGRIGAAGVDLAARIKRVSPNTPIVLLCGSPPPEAEAVCDRVLTKTGPLGDLVAALQSLDVVGVKREP